MNRFAIILLLASFFPGMAHATEYPPADHGGGDLTLEDGDVIWGAHTNLGTFTVPEGCTVSVKFYDGSNRFEDMTATSTGTLTVSADHIVIAGKLTAEGAGYTGGPGGGGGGAYGYNGGLSGVPRYPFRLSGNAIIADAGAPPGCCFAGCGGLFCTGGTFPGGIGASGDGPDRGYYRTLIWEWWRSCGGYMEPLTIRAPNCPETC